MNVRRLIKLLPNLLLVGALGYCGSAIQSEAPGAARADVQKGLELMVSDLMTEGSEAAVKFEGKLRDPFWAAVAASATREAAPEEHPVAAGADALAEFVRGLSLDATMIHGRDQLAVIDGRIYARGQRLPVPEDVSVPGQELQVFAVTRTGVLLKGGGKNYMLGYPDHLEKKKSDDDEPAARERAMAEIDPAGQMEMFQKLLNSPLGKMGKGLIGDAVSPKHRPGAAGPAQTRRPSNARTRAPGAGGP